MTFGRDLVPETPLSWTPGLGGPGKRFLQELKAHGDEQQMEPPSIWEDGERDEERASPSTWM